MLKDRRNWILQELDIQQNQVDMKLKYLLYCIILVLLVLAAEKEDKKKY